jgi:steroid delta-isomerase-like uncharacterized protein
MLNEDLKSRLLWYVDQLWNQHNLAVIDEMILPEFVDHSLPAGSPQGPEGARQFAQVYLTAFPDTHLDFNETVGEGDTVVLRWTATGTHSGDLAGIPPTGKKMVLPGLALWRFQGEKFIESWNLFNQLTLLQQIGAFPAPAANQ